MKPSGLYIRISESQWPEATSERCVEYMYQQFAVALCTATL